MNGPTRLLSIYSEALAARLAFRIFTSPRPAKAKRFTPLFKQAQKLQFLFEGKTVKGYRWNFPSVKKLLILHGYESSIVHFEPYIRPLMEKGYEVLGFDAPAHGHSDGKSIDVVLYKEFVLKICRQYGPVHYFITHSFGGLALSLALEELSHDARFKVVFIAPATETKRAIQNFFSLLKLNSRIGDEFTRIIINQGGKDPSWYSVARASENIKAEVLFLQDEEDPLTPMIDVLPIIKKAYPNFKFIISSGLGHRRIYRDENSIISVLSFF